MNLKMYAFKKKVGVHLTGLCLNLKEKKVQTRAQITKAQEFSKPSLIYIHKHKHNAIR